MLTLKALIQVTVFDEGIFTVPAFRAFKSFRPSELEEMFPAIIFRLKAVHKLSQIHCVLLHGFYLARVNLILLSYISVSETTL